MSTARMMTMPPQRRPAATTGSLRRPPYWSTDIAHSARGRSQAARYQAKRSACSACSPGKNSAKPGASCGYPRARADDVVLASRWRHRESGAVCRPRQLCLICASCSTGSQGRIAEANISPGSANSRRAVMSQRKDCLQAIPFTTILLRALVVCSARLPRLGSRLSRPGV